MKTSTDASAHDSTRNWSSESESDKLSGEQIWVQKRNIKMFLSTESKKEVMYKMLGSEKFSHFKTKWATCDSFEQVKTAMRTTSFRNALETSTEKCVTYKNFVICQKYAWMNLLFSEFHLISFKACNNDKKRGENS